MQIKVEWDDLKSFVDSRGLSMQWVVKSNLYWISAADGQIQFSTQIPIVIPTPANSPQEDFENNYKEVGNQSPNTTVTTQFEFNNKDLKLAKCKGIVDNATKQAVVYLQIPGQFGVDDGRWIAGGYATTDTFDPDDYACVYFEDKDRIIAWLLARAQDPEASAPIPDEIIQQMGVLPAPFNEAFPEYPIVKSYTDDDVPPENQGWYFDPMVMGNNLPPLGYCDIEPIAGYGHAIAGFYLKIVWVRANATSGTIRVSLWWGKKE